MDQGPTRKLGIKTESLKLSKEFNNTFIVTDRGSTSITHLDPSSFSNSADNKPQNYLLFIFV